MNEQILRMLLGGDAPDTMHGERTFSGLRRDGFTMGDAFRHADREQMDKRELWRMENAHKGVGIGDLLQWLLSQGRNAKEGNMTRELDRRRGLLD